MITNTEHPLFKFHTKRFFNKKTLNLYLDELNTIQYSGYVCKILTKIHHLSMINPQDFQEIWMNLLKSEENALAPEAIDKLIRLTNKFNFSPPFFKNILIFILKSDTNAARIDLCEELFELQNHLINENKTIETYQIQNQTCLQEIMLVIALGDNFLKELMHPEHSEKNIECLVKSTYQFRFVLKAIKSILKNKYDPSIIQHVCYFNEPGMYLSAYIKNEEILNPKQNPWNFQVFLNSRCPKTALEAIQDFNTISMPENHRQIFQATLLKIKFKDGIFFLKQIYKDNMSFNDDEVQMIAHAMLSKTSTWSPNMGEQFLKMFKEIRAESHPIIKSSLINGTIKTNKPSDYSKAITKIPTQQSHIYHYHYLFAHMPTPIAQSKLVMALDADHQLKAKVDNIFNHHALSRLTPKQFFTLKTLLPLYRLPNQEYLCDQDSLTYSLIEFTNEQVEELKSNLFSIINHGNYDNVLKIMSHIGTSFLFFCFSGQPKFTLDIEQFKIFLHLVKEEIISQYNVDEWLGIISKNSLTQKFETILKILKNNLFFKLETKEQQYRQIFDQNDILSNEITQLSPEENLVWYEILMHTLTNSEHKELLAKTFETIFEQKEHGAKTIILFKIFSPILEWPEYFNIYYEQIMSASPDDFIQMKSQGIIFQKLLNSHLLTPENMQLVSTLNLFHTRKLSQDSIHFSNSQYLFNCLVENLPFEQRFNRIGHLSSQYLNMYHVNRFNNREIEAVFRHVNILIDDPIYYRLISHVPFFMANFEFLQNLVIAIAPYQNTHEQVEAASNYINQRLNQPFNQIRIIHPHYNPQAINYNQSVHGRIMEESAFSSLRHLKNLYADQASPFTTVLTEISTLLQQRKHIQNNTQSQNALTNLKLKAAESCLNNLKNTSYTHEGISTLTLLTLVWAAVNDSTHFHPKVTVETAQDNLISGLYQMQRSYNIDENDNDDMKNDRPSCTKGAFIILLACLNTIHDAINIIFITKAQANLKFPTIVKKHLTHYLKKQSTLLSPDDFQELLKHIDENDISNIWPHIQQNILHEFFDEFKGVFSNNINTRELHEIMSTYIDIDISSVLRTFDHRNPNNINTIGFFANSDETSNSDDQSNKRSRTI